MKRLLIALAFAALGLAGITLAQVTTNPSATGVAASRGQLPGEPSNGTACAGCVGELITASLVSGSATALVNDTAKTVISLTVTPGDWDVSGVGCFTGGATTTVNYTDVSISTTDNTIGAFGAQSWQVYGATAVVLFSLADPCSPTPVVRVSTATSIPVYLVHGAHFGTSTAAGYGFIRARRAR